MCIAVVFFSGYCGECFLIKHKPANIYLFKVSNRNSRKRCGICSKLTIKTTERHQNASVSNVDIEQVIICWKKITIINIFMQRRIQNPVNYLRWGVLKAVYYFRQTLYPRCLTSFCILLCLYTIKQYYRSFPVIDYPYIAR